jgi:hypothetical protein
MFVDAGDNRDVQADSVEKNKPQSGHASISMRLSRHAKTVPSRISMRDDSLQF